MGRAAGDVDHGASTANSTLPGQVPSSFLPVTFYDDAGSNASLLVDYVYIRQYRNPEPMVTLGQEQGYIDLAIGMTDSPDPLYAGETLTYLADHHQHKQPGCPRGSGDRYPAKHW